MLQTGAFACFAASTLVGRGVAEGVYFAFLMGVVFAASLATGLCQNGVFAFVAGYGRGAYTQAIMTGQAVAGVLPCVAQIAAVLVAGERDATGVEERGRSAWAACGYFLVAAGVSVGALGALGWLWRGRGEGMGPGVKDAGVGDGDEDERDGMERAEVDGDLRERKVVGLWTLLSKLRWLAAAVFTCFAFTMLYPVFTQEILSVRPADAAPPLLRPACFIPLAFLLWNTGDLTGRLVTLLPPLSLTRYPRALFAISLARLGFVPLYLLCNIRGRGAVVGGDVFYLVGVQFLFGITNGYLGSSCMMGAAEWVEVEEREAAGGFMGLMLVGGLTAGSLLSFLVAGIQGWEWRGSGGWLDTWRNALHCDGGRELRGVGFGVYGTGVDIWHYIAWRYKSLER